jgi:pyrimidine operon attenuation protein/uracil phosphoribosyltransferase
MATAKGGTYMKAIAVIPGRPNSVHLASLAKRRSRRFPAAAGFW